MANKQNKDLISLSAEEIQTNLLEAQEDMLRLKLDHAVSAIKKPSTITLNRRQIARMHTELRRRELEEGGAVLAAKRDRIRLRRKLNK